MEFALKFLNDMEHRYPGVIAMMQRNPGNWVQICASRHVDTQYFNGMHALMHWKKDKIIYNFDDDIAIEIFEQTQDPEDSIVASYLQHLPFSSIAIHIVPFTVYNDPSSTKGEQFSGNAFIWLEGTVLHSAWEADHYRFLHVHVDLSHDTTLSDVFQRLAVENLLQHFSAKEIEEMLSILDIQKFDSFSSYGEEEINKLKLRFHNRTDDIIDAIYLSSVQEVMVQRVIHYVLYLNCANADIEAAEEKLKAGCWASILEKESKSAPVDRNTRRRALREIEGTTVMDVGYRIASKYKPASFAETSSPTDHSSSGKKRGYSKRRAHYHHFWIGPRNAPIAENFLQPKDGERGMVLYWLDSTEIHPELRDDKVTIIPVKE